MTDFRDRFGSLQTDFQACPGARIGKERRLPRTGSELAKTPANPVLTRVCGNCGKSKPSFGRSAKIRNGAIVQHIRIWTFFESIEERQNEN